MLRTKLAHLVRIVTRRWRAPNSEGSILYDSREHMFGLVVENGMFEVRCQSRGRRSSERYV